MLPSKVRIKWIVLAVIAIQCFIIYKMLAGRDEHGKEYKSEKVKVKRYLMIKGVEGRFGNALLQLKNAAIIAKTLDRVLVSSVNFQTTQGVNLFDVFEIGALRSAGFRIEEVFPAPRMKPEVRI
jgi:hypothetical protein